MDFMTDFKKLPVTVLSGFLGAGKTTLLKHILNTNHNYKIAVIVNDMAALNIDADRTRVVQKEAKMVEMANGCICCTLREDLLVEVKKLALERKFDYLVIESTGVSEPIPVAETFTFGDLELKEEKSEGEEVPANDADASLQKKRKLEDAECVAAKKQKTDAGQNAVEQLSEGAEEKACEEQEHAGKPEDSDPTCSETKHSHHNDHSHSGKVLSDVASLDTMVTVVDAKGFMGYLQSEDSIFERWGQEVEEDDWEEEEQTVSKLLIDQIEFANVILLNKTDLVDKSELVKVNAMIMKLNPDAKVLRTKHSKVDLKEVLNTGLFDFDRASEHAGWLKEMRGQHVPETLEYGISSFTIRHRRPFDGRRFFDLLESEVLVKQVIRAKGLLWLDCYHDTLLDFDISGASIGIEPQQPWFAALEESEWGIDDEEVRAQLKEQFVGPFGDRRNELVFIGDSMNEEQIRKLLDECVLTDEEFSKGAEVWSKSAKPFEDVNEVMESD